MVLVFVGVWVVTTLICVEICVVLCVDVLELDFASLCVRLRFLRHSTGPHDLC